MSGANDRDLQALHYLVKRIRSETMGAGEWHDAGISAVLARMKGHNLAIVIERVTRHAADPTARTPAAMERKFLPDAPVAGPPSPPKPSEACRICGRHINRCVCDTAPQVRPIPKPADTAERAARLRELADEATATHCSHGVDPRYCTDHRPTQPTDRPTTTAREGLRGAHRE